MYVDVDLNVPTFTVTNNTSVFPAVGILNIASAITIDVSDAISTIVVIRSRMLPAKSLCLWIHPCFRFDYILSSIFGFVFPAASTLFIPSSSSDSSRSRVVAGANQVT